MQAGMKRRPSEEMGGSVGASTGLATPIGSGGAGSSGAPSGKKLFILAGPWDLEIPTNVILYERQPTMLPHPSPEVELVRYAFVMKLRQSYQVRKKKTCEMTNNLFVTPKNELSNCPIHEFKVP